MSDRRHSGGRDRDRRTQRTTPSRHHDHDHGGYGARRSSSSRDSHSNHQLQYQQQQQQQQQQHQQPRKSGGDVGRSSRSRDARRGSQDSRPRHEDARGAERSERLQQGYSSRSEQQPRRPRQESRSGDRGRRGHSVRSERPRHALAANPKEGSAPSTTRTKRRWVDVVAGSASSKATSSAGGPSHSQSPALKRERRPDAQQGGVEPESRWTQLAKGTESVCITLGPYRNLTTLTASLVSLHPNCQVLNHGGDRIFGTPKFNFFLDPTQPRKTMDAFVEHALEFSSHKARGQKGGSIIFSHAFDDKYPLKGAFVKRYGSSLVKDDVKCLFWKESQRTLNLVQGSLSENALATLMDVEPRLRFLMPIRNPLDVMGSTFTASRHHIALFGLKHTASSFQVLDAILQSLHAVLQLRKKLGGDRVFVFTEHDLRADAASCFQRIGTFLKLPHDDTWVHDVAQCCSLNPSSYTHSKRVCTVYARWVHRRFARDFPELVDPFLDFVPAEHRSEVTVAKSEHSEASLTESDGTVVEGMTRSQLLDFISSCAGSATAEAHADSQNAQKLLHIAASMDQAGYVTAQSSKRFNLDSALDSESSLNLAKDLLQSLKDNCNVHTMPVFVHIPRNAGHFIASHYVVNNMGPSKVAKTDIVVCRNPYDRLVSTYKHFHEQSACTQTSALSTFCSKSTFGEFVLAVCQERRFSDDPNVWPQSSFAEKFEHVVYFETLATDVAFLEDIDVLQLASCTKAAAGGGPDSNTSKSQLLQAAGSPAWLRYFEVPNGLQLLQAVEKCYNSDFKVFDYPKCSTNLDFLGPNVGGFTQESLLKAVVKHASSAIEEGDYASALCHDLKKLLQKGNFKDNDESVGRALENLALVAAQKGRRKVLMSFLDNFGVSVDTFKRAGRSSLLHIAAYHGYQGICEDLVQRGANLRCWNKWKETPHKTAAAKGYAQIAKLLVPK